MDDAMREPVREEHGFCVRCAPNEAGLAIGKIRKDTSDAGNRFDGYTSQQETEKKILRNVFVKGDAWFATGDLMRKDEQGYFYFVDRLGDTFRWKGENVSTSEVAEAISELPEVAEAIVYGVSIPGTDGRVGMAALVLTGRLDLAVLRSYLAERLPSYARPMFVRIKRTIEVTDTFKYTKKDLVSEGFNPRIIDDPIYFDDPTLCAFVPVDTILYNAIQRGDIRL
jgi:fatty-acyl-CoA synthase